MAKQNNSGFLKNSGGLWKSESQSGKKFYFGKIDLPNGKKIVFRAFPNSYKEKGDKKPDFNLTLDKDQTTADVGDLDDFATKPKGGSKGDSEDDPL